MKGSKYNYFARKENRVICLNGITGKMLSLDDEEYSFLQAMFNDNDLQAKFPNIIHKLVEGHFLVQDDTQEIDKLRKQNRIAFDQQGYNLTINPTQDCNFKCWYCYENHIKSRMSEDIQSRIKLFVNKELERRNLKYFSLNWFGGEPLLYFNEVVYPLSVYIKNATKNYSVPFSNSMTTNGYLLTQEVAQKCKDINLDLLQVTLDGNRKIHNRVRNDKGKPSFDQILENCIYYLQKHEKGFVILRVNYTTHNIVGVNYAEILSFIPQEIRTRIQIQFHRVWQTYDKEGNDLKVKHSLKENQDNLRTSGFAYSNNIQYSLYKGFVCYADRKHYANINYDGRVYRCTAQDYKPDNSLGHINEYGDIVWKDKKLKKIDEIANFENPVCLDCKFLPLCGGPCFAKRLQMEQAGKYFCPMTKMDTDIDQFIIDSYDNIIEKRKKHHESSLRGRNNNLETLAYE